MVLLLVCLVIVANGGGHALAREEAPAITPFATAHVVITGAISAAGQELPVQGEGDIDAARSASRLTVGLPGAAFESIVADGRTYNRNAATGRWEWTEGAGANGFNAARLAPYDPATIRAAGRNFTRVGTEAIDGVAATHWRADADLARLLGAPGGLGPLGSGAEGATMDLWLADGDGRLRRLVVTTNGATSAPGSAASATPVASRLTLSLTFSNFDKPVSIVAPPGAVPAATPRATAVGSATARAAATPTFAGVAATAAPIPNNPLADITSGQGWLSARMIIRFVAVCSIVAVALAILVAVRHRRQMEARRGEES